MAQLAVAAVLLAVSMAITASRKIEGPRLDDLKFTGGDYGAPLALVWGMRRMQTPIFWAEPLREVKRRRKTKGGKFNDYSYYGTWAVALAGHEIDAVRRIWFDTHLVYDLSGAGPVTPFDLGDIGSIEDIISIYLGTEAQEPDERIAATVNAAQGAGSTPAYRGTAYVVFKDIPLEKLGNRIPQVSVELAGGAAYPASNLTVSTNPTSLRFSNDHATLLLGSASEFSLVDVAARAEIINSTFGLTTYDGHDYFVWDDGTVLASESPAHADVVGFDLSGSATLVYDSATPHGNIWAQTDSAGEDHYAFAPNVVDGPFVVDGVAIDPLALAGAAFTAQGFFLDQDDAIWVIGHNATDTFLARIGAGSGAGLVSVNIGLGSYAGMQAFHFRDAIHDQFVFSLDGDLYAIDRETGALLASNTAVPSGFAGFLDNITPASTTVWSRFAEISLADLTVVRTLDPANWGSTSAITRYDPINHALLTMPSASVIRWHYLDRVGTTGVLLSTIAGDIADLAGVADYDFSDLNQTVQGWSATRGQASNMLEPLLDAYDSDIRPNEFQVEGLKRTGVSGGTILTERFVGDPRYAVKVRQSAELPKSLTVTFADVDAEQQPNAARVSRPLDATGAAGEQSIDLSTWASDVDEARQLTDRFFRRMWNERKEISLSLTAQHFALEPGDCRTLDLDGESDIYRCTRLTAQASGALATEWKYDHPSLAVLDGASGAAFDGRADDVIIVPLLSKGFVLDVPYITDADDQATPIVYVAGAPYAAGAWPGAIVYQAVDGEYSEEIASVATSSQATWGYATGVLANASPWLWDRGGSVNVMLQVGTLTGTTEAAIDANPLLNLALIGDEFVNFTTATLEGDGSYTLSGFKRGRRGTEWACSTHVARDVFLLLDTVTDAAMGLSEVGTNLSFKAITAGRTTGFPEDIEPYSGASLKPYAPCHLEAVKDAGTGDWTITWVRRTRVGGAWTSGTTIPLSETTEEYDVVITHPTLTTRTITVSTATATYTAAQQVTDGGAVAVGDLDAVIYQISAAVDRGFAATLTA